MKIVVTGSKGMLGSNILRTINESKSHQGIGLSREILDLRDGSLVASFFAKEKPDAVIHAAAKVGGIQANINQPFDFLADNLLLDSTVIQSSLSAGIQNFLYIASSCMYPKDYRQPLLESDLLAGGLEPTNEGYAIAKISASKLCEYASTSYGVSYKSIVPSNLYGPGDNFRQGSSHLLASAIRKVHELKETGAAEIDVWGSGAARREFTFVEDLSSWVTNQVHMISEFPPLLNLGYGVDYSVNDLYREVLAALEVDATLVHDMSKPEGMRAKLMDSSVARVSHSWNPQTDLVTGIKKTYKWFLESGKTNGRV